MANDESILREVNQELAEDDLNQKLRTYGPMIAGAGAALVVGVAAWQFWTAREEAAARAHALEFNAAVELLGEDRDAGRDALAALGEEGGGYGALARLQAAASYAGGGERLRAVETYRAVYTDGGVQRRVREFARLRAAYLSLADGRDAVLSDLGSLPEAEGPFGVYAREISALAALGAEDYETAQSMFRDLTIDLSAPAPVRERAEDFAALAASGKVGVNITGEARVEDLIRAVGEATEDGAAGEDASAIEGAADASSAIEGVAEDAADAIENAGVAEEGAAEESAASDGTETASDTEARITEDGASDETAPSDDPETGNEAP